MPTKYNLRELEEMQVLPDDCNAEAEEVATKLLDACLSAMLVRARKERWYGKAVHSGSQNIVFEFKDGICRHFYKPVIFDKNNTFMRSIKNI